MGRTYAGILGCLAFCTVLARGLLGGMEAHSTIIHACGSMFAFALMGMLAGTYAESLVTNGVRMRFISALGTEHESIDEAASEE